MKILATPQMVEVRLRMLREGRIKRPAPSQPPTSKRAPAPSSGPAMANGRSNKRAPGDDLERSILPDDEFKMLIGEGVKDYLDRINRVQERRRGLAVQAHPLAFKSPPKPSNANDPTPEWQAKAGSHMASQSIGKGEIAPLKRYRIRHVVEQHGDKLSMMKRSALERFMQDATYSMRIAVCDPNRSGSYAAPGSRLGGLGNVPQFVRDGHSRHEWIRSRLCPEMLETANALVTRELMKTDGTPFSLEDFGAHMFPGVTDKNRRWGAAAGALWSLAAGLVFLYGRCPVKIRPRDADDVLEIVDGGRQHDRHSNVR